MKDKRTLYRALACVFFILSIFVFGTRPFDPVTMNDTPTSSTESPSSSPTSTSSQTTKASPEATPERTLSETVAETYEKRLEREAQEKAQRLAWLKTAMENFIRDHCYEDDGTFYTKQYVGDSYVAMQEFEDLKPNIYNAYEYPHTAEDDANGIEKKGQIYLSAKLQRDLKTVWSDSSQSETKQWDCYRSGDSAIQFEAVLYKSGKVGITQIGGGNYEYKRPTKNEVVGAGWYPKQSDCR